MIKSIKNLLFITVPSLIVLAVLLELIFTFIIPASDPPQNYFDEDERIFKFTPGQGGGTHSIGWAARQRTRWRINNEGWNSPYDYDTARSRPRIAVIGDSYVEAMQVDYFRSFAALLGAELSASHDVYSFGISSAPLSQYLHMSRHVAARFDPDVMIFTIVMNDFDESVNGIHHIPYMMTLKVDADSVREIGPVADRNQSQYDPRKRLLKKSALFRYFLYNLRFRHTMKAAQKEDAAGGFVDNTKPAMIGKRIGEIRRVVDYVVSAIARENPGRRLIFVLDAPRERIYSGGSEPYALEPLRQMTKEACSRSGIEVIDLEVPMTRDFSEHGRRFSSEYDNHWDEYGHEIVARTLLGHI